MLEVKDYSKQELADALYAKNIKPASRLRKVRESTDILPSAFSYLCIVSHESATKQVLRVEIAGINSSNC